MTMTPRGHGPVLSELVSQLVSQSVSPQCEEEFQIVCYKPSLQGNIQLELQMGLVERKLPPALTTQLSLWLPPSLCSLNKVSAS